VYFRSLQAAFAGCKMMQQFSLLATLSVFCALMAACKIV